MNDNLYNPDLMSKEDIKTLFVARQPLLDELVATVRTQPKGAGVQHLLIIAPRGMGKTTMLLMVQFAVEDNADLSKNWQAVRFPEESYDITELADFWLKVLRYLDDENLKSKIEEIESRFRKSEDLREAAWALVKDWSRANKKRIVLLVDNFDMILDQIGNDVEQARLRDILMNDGTVMLIGCAPSYFRQIQDYEQPLYNFFKIQNLGDLKFPDIEELIRRRAEIDDIPNIEELLQKNRTRIKALETFTGGNPRLVLMLYRIITSSDMTEVRNGLEKLLDAVTPYYKDKTEKLPPQQRKIINEIAQYSLEKNEGISPTEIAKKIRMTANQVSTQLKRLSDNGYVKALNIRGRSSFYVISEPLYAIWAQMRFGRNAREKRNWLVQILKAIYDVQEIQKEIEKLGGRYVNLVKQGQENKARGTLEYMVCLMEAHSNFIEENYSLVINVYLKLNEDASILALITPDKVVKLPKETIETLVSREILKKEDLEKYYSTQYEKVIGAFFKLLSSFSDDFNNKNKEEAIENLNYFISSLEKAVDENEEYEIFIAILQSVLAGFYHRLGKFEEAVNESDRAIKILTKYAERSAKVIGLYLAMAYWIKGQAFIEKMNIDEAISNLDESARFTNLTIKAGDNTKIVLEVKAKIYLYKFQIGFAINQLDKAELDFTEYVKTIKEIDYSSWIEIASSNLIQVSRFTDLQSIERVIKNIGFETEFFPLIRSINYLRTKDENLIDKLSPEIGLVVEEIIKTLQMIEEGKSKSEANQNKKNKKGKASEKSKSLALPK